MKEWSFELAGGWWKSPAPYPFWLSFIRRSIFHNTVLQVVEFLYSGTALLAPCGCCRKRALFRRPGFMWGNQKQQVMETAGPVGWLWPGGSGKMVSGPSWLHCHFLFLYPFILFLPSFYRRRPSSTAPAFLPESLPPIRNRWVAPSRRWPGFALQVIKATHLTYIFT